MNIYEYKFDHECVVELEESFENGPIIDDSGRHYLTEGVVDRIGALSILIFSNEHPPPHFCIKYNGQTANYTISDCSKINGDLSTFDRNIRKWHAKNKKVLIDYWNKMRPTDCPVGKIEEDKSE